ncbi:hypothetical protein HOU03_gp384 [Caulobacter phage CcrSC]|uniref:Uncharacterized protein n=1 Tax=Caulobacter phage CcrSC TaxID=2283272 RepID=A0A385EDC8_9CAUD|nr:hypothetical protein HOU03_gp384 [Caulobacter phage CcrSC]AXQ69884.1 hypothetical protein CcrSC_gp302 [Caulobacter phage CcrSC]
MKLKRPLKSASDLKRGARLVTPAQRAKLDPLELANVVAAERKMKAYEDERAAGLEAAKRSPLDAYRAGKGYTGDNMPDKGQRDGSCNRTACQLPLAGNRQFYMKDHFTGGRLYYCPACERKFTEADRQFREPQRCQPDEDNDNRPRWETYE